MDTKTTIQSLLLLGSFSSQGDLSNTLTPGDDCRQVIMSGVTEWISRDVWPSDVAPILIGGDFNGGWFRTDRPSGGLTARDAQCRRWADLGND
eukprot:6988539-Pyramimonas_sp.AAC.1